MADVTGAFVKERNLSGGRTPFAMTPELSRGFQVGVISRAEVIMPAKSRAQQKAVGAASDELRLAGNGKWPSGEDHVYIPSYPAMTEPDQRCRISGGFGVSCRRTWWSDADL